MIFMQIRLIEGGDHLLRAQGAVRNCAQTAAILRVSNLNGGREVFER